MSQLNSLKNNSKGIDALNKMIGSNSPFQWMSETLCSMKLETEFLPWKKLLLKYEEDVRCLAMHRDSYLRLQGCSILLYSQNTNSRRHLWGMFNDSSRDIRILMIRFFQSADRHRLYNTLFKMYLNDPVPEVRKSAHNRITKDFSDLYSIIPTALSLEEKVHCLELLNINSSHDHNLALQLMNDPHPGVVLAAGLYLEQSGTLDSKIKKARLKDMEDIKARIRLLQTAADHQLISFLCKKENFNDPGSLYIALSLYESGIQSPLTSWILEQIFELKKLKPLYTDMKKRALSCLVQQKDPHSLILIRDLLDAKNNETLPFLLDHLPLEAALIYYPVLKTFIMDTEFTYPENLIRAFKSIPVNLCLSDLFSLISDLDLAIEIRRRALIILSSFQEYSSTLFMLENLNLLSKDEMQDLAASVSSWNKESFDKNVSIIFKQPDASLHRSLIELLASAGVTSYISQIEEKLLSPEAQTRTTALQTLFELNSRESLEKMKTLFYDTDPVVKAHTASVFINWDIDECFDEIQSLLQNNYELPEIHRTILEAIEASENSKLIPIVAKLFKKDGIPEEILIRTLKEKHSIQEIKILISLYKDSDAFAKNSFQKLFKIMGEQGESALMTLLSENFCSAEITEILEKTGYIDRLIEELKSPFSKKRKAAAEALSFISNKKACTALLTAARDISSDIRKLSLSALSRAQKEMGMLSLLKEDPDKKIKRLAHWAEAGIEKAGNS